MSLRVQSPLPAALEVVINKTIGAAIDVHRQLGPGFLESIYEQALCYELSNRGIRFARQKEIAIRYKEIVLTGQRLILSSKISLSSN